MKVALLEALLEARHDKRPVVLVTSMATGAQRLADADDADAAVGRALRSDRCQTVDDRFYQPFNPPLRLVVVGAVHVTQELVPMARRLGYAVVVVDPRPAFARAERFEGVEVHAGWPDEVLPTLGLDRRTAVVTFTHDPKIDDPALVEALKSDAFYVGALGSRKTHAARRVRLLAEGVDEGAFDRIHGPIGLPLGGRSPAEIALSTMAQITQVLRRGEDPSRRPRSAGPPRVVGVVLAAGRSRRMGATNKLLAEVDGVPMVCRVVDALLASPLEAVWVVTGHDADAVRGALAGRPVTFVDNPDAAEGMGTSVRAAARSLGDHDGALFALGDMPWLRADHVARLLADFRGDPRAVCVPTFEGTRGNPVLWGQRWFAQLRSLGGDVGARRLLGDHPEAVRLVPMPDGAVLDDVDTPDALARARRGPR